MNLCPHSLERDPASPRCSLCNHVTDLLPVIKMRFLQLFGVFVPLTSSFEMFRCHQIPDELIFFHETVSLSTSVFYFSFVNEILVDDEISKSLLSVFLYIAKTFFLSPSQCL